MANHELEQMKTVIKERLLIERLELEDITANDIGDEMPLFGEGLGLDSVEAFEVMIGMEELFGISTDNESPEQMKEHMYSVDTMSRFIAARLANAAGGSANAGTTSA